MIPIVTMALTEWMSTLAEIVQWLISQITGIIDGLVGADSILLPLFLLGIGISLIMVVFKIVRKITWGA